MMQLCKIPNHSLQTFSIPKSFLQYILPAAFFTASNIQGSRLIWKKPGLKNTHGCLLWRTHHQSRIILWRQFLSNSKGKPSKAKKNILKKIMSTTEIDSSFASRGLPFRVEARCRQQDYTRPKNSVRPITL